MPWHSTSTVKKTLVVFILAVVGFRRCRCRRRRDLLINVVLKTGGRSGRRSGGSCDAQADFKDRGRASTIRIGHGRRCSLVDYTVSLSVSLSGFVSLLDTAVRHHVTGAVGEWVARVGFGAWPDTYWYRVRAWQPSLRGDRSVSCTSTILHLPPGVMGPGKALAAKRPAPDQSSTTRIMVAFPSPWIARLAVPAHAHDVRSRDGKGRYVL